jgi:Fic family protein
VAEASLRLSGKCHPETLGKLRELVRSMNSYYSNRLEGQGTHPVNIDQALRKQFSAVPDTARRQRIAIAHIEAERELEGLAPPVSQVLSSQFLLVCHGALYGRLALEDRVSEKGVRVDPGVWRSEDVTVGDHHPPVHASLPDFLQRADAEYMRGWGLESLLVATAAAHHRLAWVHPFIDGNGRAVRLQTHMALHHLSAGLWSVNRALARKREDYYRLLAEADLHRQNDIDGRGNLSERFLQQWCAWFIDQCRDQVGFMSRMLDLDNFKSGITALMLTRGEAQGRAGYRRELVLPILHIFATGPVTRGEFTQMTGLSERVASSSIRVLLNDGLLSSPSPKGKLFMEFPLDALGMLLPNLYPEAAVAPGAVE